jgi:hypothetical protein
VAAAAAVLGQRVAQVAYLYMLVQVALAALVLAQMVQMEHNPAAEVEVLPTQLLVLALLAK